MCKKFNKIYIKFFFFLDNVLAIIFFNRIHYQQKVKFESSTGHPLCPSDEPFGQLTEEEKIHTKFFYENGFSISKLPQATKPIHVPKNPFEAARKNKASLNVEAMETEQVLTDMPLKKFVQKIIFKYLT